MEFGAIEIIASGQLMAIVGVFFRLGTLIEKVKNQETRMQLIERKVA